VPAKDSKVKQDELTLQPLEFRIDELFKKPNIDTILGGTVKQGVIREGDQVSVGPLDTGQFIDAVVSSIHRNRTPCREAMAGHSAAVALRILNSGANKADKVGVINKGVVKIFNNENTEAYKMDKVDVNEKNHNTNSLDQTVINLNVNKQHTSCCTFSFRRGQVLLSSATSAGEMSKQVCREFEADLFLLFHATQISPKYQATIHIGSVVQTVVILSISKQPLKTGQRARVKFRFLRTPECMHKGDRILMREGRTKAVGEVTEVYPYIHKEEEGCLNSNEIATNTIQNQLEKKRKRTHSIIESK